MLRLREQTVQMHQKNHLPGLAPIVLIVFLHLPIPFQDRLTKEEYPDLVLQQILEKVHPPGPGHHLMRENLPSMEHREMVHQVPEKVLQILQKVPRVPEKVLQLVP